MALTGSLTIIIICVWKAPAVNNVATLCVEKYIDISIKKQKYASNKRCIIIKFNFLYF